MPDVKVLANGNVLVSIPIILRESAGRKRIINDEKSSKLMKDGVTVCQLEDELSSKVEQIDDTELEEIISIDEI